MFRRILLALGHAVQIYDAHNPTLIIEQRMHDARVRKALLKYRPGR